MRCDLFSVRCVQWEGSALCVMAAACPAAPAGKGQQGFPDTRPQANRQQRKQQQQQLQVAKKCQSKETSSWCIILFFKKTGVVRGGVVLQHEENIRDWGVVPKQQYS